MDTISCVLCLVLTWALIRALLSVIHMKSKAGSSKLPRGPVPLPVIGNLLDLGDKPHRSLAEMAKNYGPVMSLKLGRKTTVVVSSAEIARQVLQTNDLVFCNRSIPDAMFACNQHEFSLTFIPATTRWRTLRRICSSHVFSRKKLEESQHLRRREVRNLLRSVEESCVAGSAVDVGEAAFRTSLNLLSNTFFSVDLVGHCSGSAQEFKDLVWSMAEEAGRPNLSDFFPALKMLDPQGARRRMAIYMGKMFDMFSTMIEQRLKSREMAGSRSSEDVLDILLDINEEDTHNMEKGWIEHLFLDLFAAGTETTSSTVEWAMAELLRNPEKLWKAQAEVRDTIGRGNPVEESDLPRLPYLKAVVNESLRLHPSVPFLVPRKCDADTQICGFTVPKGAQVLVNVWKIGRDPSLWDNPLSFTPERFMGSEIDIRGQNFELLPFGAGRRICPGLPLAMRMVPLIMSSLLHSFNWTLPHRLAPQDMNMEEKVGFALRMAQPLLAVPTRI